MTFPIQVDATHLTTPRFLIAGVTGWLETASIHTLQLEPGTFSVQTPAGIRNGVRLPVGRETVTEQ